MKRRIVFSSAYEQALRNALTAVTQQADKGGYAASDTARTQFAFYAHIKEHRYRRLRRDAEG
jgi:hypothetical protein